MFPSPKYRGAKTDMDGVPLQWVGHPSGLPVEGDRDPLLKPEELDAAGIQLKAHYHCYRLPAEAEAYVQLKDRAVNGVEYIERELIRDGDKPDELYVHVWWATPSVKPPAGSGRY